MRSCFIWRISLIFRIPKIMRNKGSDDSEWWINWDYRFVLLPDT